MESKQGTQLFPMADTLFKRISSQGTARDDQPRRKEKSVETMASGCQQTNI